MSHMWKLTAYALILLSLPVNIASFPIFIKNPLGILLITHYGGKDVERLVSQLRLSLGKNYLLEAYSGTITTRDLQKSIDRLSLKNVKKIIVVPLMLNSVSPEIEHLQYLFGIRKQPSRSYQTKWKMASQRITRIKLSIPLLMTSALDDSPFVSKSLLGLAQSISKHPAKEALLIIAKGSGHKLTDRTLSNNLNTHLKYLKQEGRFKIVKSFFLSPKIGINDSQHLNSIKVLRKNIRRLSSRHRVLLLTYVLSRDGTHREIKKKLDNLFYKWSDQALLPNTFINLWVKHKVKSFSKKKDMVKFKDEGSRLPPLNPLERFK